MDPATLSAHWALIRANPTLFIPLCGGLLALGVVVGLFFRGMALETLTKRLAEREARIRELEAGLPANPGPVPVERDTAPPGDLTQLPSLREELDATVAQLRGFHEVWVANADALEQGAGAESTSRLRERLGELDEERRQVFEETVQDRVLSLLAELRTRLDWEDSAPLLADLEKCARRPAGPEDIGRAADCLQAMRLLFKV